MKTYMIRGWSTHQGMVYFMKHTKISCNVCSFMTFKACLHWCASILFPCKWDFWEGCQGHEESIDDAQEDATRAEWSLSHDADGRTQFQTLKTVPKTPGSQVYVKWTLSMQTACPCVGKDATEVPGSGWQSHKFCVLLIKYGGLACQINVNRPCNGVPSDRERWVPVHLYLNRMDNPMLHLSLDNLDISVTVNKIQIIGYSGYLNFISIASTVQSVQHQMDGQYHKNHYTHFPIVCHCWMVLKIAWCSPLWWFESWISQMKLIIIMIFYLLAVVSWAWPRSMTLAMVRIRLWQAKLICPSLIYIMTDRSMSWGIRLCQKSSNICTMHRRRKVRALEEMHLRAGL